MADLPEKRIHQIFRISVFLKGAHAILELVGGISLLLISTSAITQIIAVLTQDELEQDPYDFFANYLVHAAAQVSVGSKTFAAFYLLSHGIIKMFLVAGLLRDKLWAYPASLGVLGLFIVYQLYRFAHTFSLGLIALTVFDLVLIVLIWHEYNLIRKHLLRE